VGRLAAVPVADTLRVRRQPQRGEYGRDAVEAALDASMVAHIAFVDDGMPYCLPFLKARIGDALYVHGATSSRAIRVLGGGAPTCVTVTAIDGLVLARSVFEHSANYRSVMLFGSFAPVAPEERLRVLEAFTDALLPGRWHEVRAPSANELAATAVLGISLEQASVKIRTGPPSDGDSADANSGAWAGVVPIIAAYGAPQVAPELTAAIPVPASVRNLTQGARR
jgi:nitroimidazol reductase NimA-like FMN-containing flavoprotein (pyridoxamine 5'-phosphate oxidase superfamily)